MSYANPNGSFRTKINPFTQVSNEAIRDENLSLKAKGLFTLIQSFITIPNFILHKSHLISICKEKEKAFDSAWKELKVNGYLKQYRIPKGKNDSFVYEYELLDVADLTTPPLINLNKNGEEIKNSDGNSHTPHLVPYAKLEDISNLAYPPFGTLCEGHPMPNGGDINNTYINNTYLNNIESNPILSHQDLSEEKNKEKTDRIGSDEIPNLSAEDENKQKNKESSKNASTNQSNTHSEPSPTVYNHNTVLEKINYDYNTVLEKIQDNINYNCIIFDNPDEKGMVDGVVHVIASTIMTNFTAGYISMGDESIPTELVKSIFFKLTKNDIDYFIANFNRQTKPTVKLNAYIRTALYKNYGIADLYYANRVRVDMPYLAGH